jgi:hypothetical protein
MQELPHQHMVKLIRRDDSDAVNPFIPPSASDGLRRKSR